MQYDTAGNPIIFYDMCGYCNMTTGGEHEPHCPCYRLVTSKVSYANVEVKVEVIKEAK